jgi:hypothetical protein
MSPSTYAAARAVAPLIEAHFARHLAALPASDRVGMAAPEADAIETMIDAAFWTSLRREEGYVPRVSLALLPPHQAAQPLMFERPLTLSPTTLARVAPAVERPGIHLGVWHAETGLRVWGTTRTIPTSAVVLEVSAPGLLVVKHHRSEPGKFVNVAVLEGDQIKIIDERSSTLPDCPEMVTSLLGFRRPGPAQGGVDVLVELAVSMRAHGRGGLLLMVPHGSEAWRESIANPIPYAVRPFAELLDLAAHSPEPDDRAEWQEALADSVTAIAGLTAVDGATVITDRFALLAFGAKIVRRDGRPQIEQLVMSEPIAGGEPTTVHPGRLGGTRHLSAAQFVHDQPDSGAMVASQDGRFTIVTWSPCASMVFAHRVESLLL